MSEQFKPEDLAKSVEAVNGAFNEFKGSVEERIKEIEKKGASDPLLDDRLKKMNDEITQHQEKINQFILSQKRQSRIVTDENGNEVDLDKKATQWADFASKQRGERAPEFDDAKMREFKAAFTRYARKGKEELTPDEIKTLSVGSSPDGGYFVHPDMGGRIVQQVYETSPMRAYASVQVISTDTLKGVYDNDEAEIFWEGETETPSTGDTPQVGEWSIPVHEMRTILKTSQKLIEDAVVNVEAWLTEKGGAKMVRGENATFVTGSGVGRPRGFLTFANSTDLTVGIEQVVTGVDGDFAAAPAGLDKLITMQGKLKQVYRANSAWFMNRTVEAAVRLEKDSNGDYLWQPSVAADRPATLLGRPVVILEDMPNIATNSLSIAYGDMRQAYQIVDRLGVSILRDPYSYKPHVGFYFRKRVGGDMINGEALKILKFAAS